MLVRKLRLQKGWSQEQLAELSGLSVRTIQRVERGYPPSLETRNALASVFEIDLSQLELEQRSMSDTPDSKALKEDEARALEYVQSLKAFYQHLFFFSFFVVIFFGGIYLVHRFVPVYMQFLVVGWSVGLMFHGLNAFEIINILGPAWERKKIEKRLGRKL